MADEAIVFKTAIDNKTLEQQLKQTSRKFENLRNKLAEKKNKKLLLEDEMRSLADQATDAENRIEELRKANERMIKQNANPALSATQRQANIEQIDLNNQEITMLEKRQKSLAKSSDALYDKWKLLGRQIETTESAINGVAKTGGKLLKKNTLVKPITDVNKGLDATKTRLAGLAKRVLFFSVFATTLRTLRRQFNGILKQNDEFRNSIGRLKGALQTAIAPLLNQLIPVLTRVVNLLAQMATILATKISRAFGKTFEDASEQAKEFNKNQKATASFDQLNQLSGNNEEIQAEYEQVAIEEQRARNLERILDIVGLIGVGIAGWKIGGTIASLFGGGWIKLIITGVLLLATFIYQHWDEISAFISNAVNWITDKVTAVSTWIRTKLQEVKDFISEIMEIGIGNVIGNLLDRLDELTKGRFHNTLETIKKFVKESVENIKQILKGIVDFVGGVFTGDWQRAWEGVKDVFKGVINQVLNIAETGINRIINLVNALIRAINNVLGNIDVPSWVTKLTGIENWSLRIPEIRQLQIPRLATGGVIPPNREFLATLGDNKREAEVVSPLSTIRQAVQEAIGTMGYGNQTVILELDGQQFARAVYKANRKETQRLGASLAGV